MHAVSARASRSASNATPACIISMAHSIRGTPNKGARNPAMLATSTADEVPSAKPLRNDMPISSMPSSEMPLMLTCEDTKQDFQWSR